MELYKLTDENGYTRTGEYNQTKWGNGVTHKVEPKQNPQLCTKDVFHAYKNINLAFLLNPNHGNYKNPQVYLAEGDVVVEDWGKVGCFELTTNEQINPPNWVGSEKEKQVRVMFAVLCAESVLHLYEDEFPDDKRVAGAIKAAKKYVKTPTADAAADAASAATYAAADATIHSDVIIDFSVLADNAVIMVMEGEK